MRGRAYGVAVSLALAALVAPARARACSIAAPSPHMIDPALVGVDQTPPQLAQPVAQVSPIEHDERGCTPKCGADYAATLTNLATDDMTPVNRIGYRVTTVAGTPPPGLTLGQVWYREAILPWPDGTLRLSFDSDDDYDFTLELVAIDAAGNESTPQTVRLRADSSGCRIGPQPGRAGAALIVIALVLAARARRRRPIRSARRAAPAPTPAARRRTT